MEEEKAEMCTVVTTVERRTTGIRPAKLSRAFARVRLSPFDARGAHVYSRHLFIRDSCITFVSREIYIVENWSRRFWGSTKREKERVRAKTVTVIIMEIILIVNANFIRDCTTCASHAPVCSATYSASLHAENSLCKFWNVRRVRKNDDSNCANYGN